MRRYLLIIGFIAGVCSANGALTLAPKKGAIEGNRFLFIVDASSQMKRLEHNGRQVVFDLVHSGVEGRMQAGDTFGVWIFGADVKTGVFPMQTWRPEDTTDLASQVGRFLKEQSTGRKSDIAAVLANAEGLARKVKDVDILIVTSAGATFKSDDDSWGVLHQNWTSRLGEARKSSKAIIITLAARAGVIRQATVSLQGERLNLAAPPERRVPQQMTSNKPTAPQPAPKVMREPIIMRGSAQPKPIEEIPTKFAPPPPAPADPPAVEPLLNPAPEPMPVPVRGTEKPIVENKVEPIAPAKPAPQPELIVAAREPGTSMQPSVQPGAVSITPRMLIFAGAALLAISAVLGTWILLHLRSRSRASYISRSMAQKP